MMNVMKKIRKRRRHEKRRGAALVEAAVTLPILLLLVMGIVEFGRAMMVVQLLTNGAREGARRGTLDGSTNTIVETHVKSILASSIGCSEADLGVTITLTPDPANNTTGNEVAAAEPGDLVNVEVSVPYDKVAYIAGSFLNGKALRARNTMRHE